jgi:hypothetical protein
VREKMKQRKRAGKDGAEKSAGKDLSKEGCRRRCIGEERVSKDTVEEGAGTDIAGRGEENTIHAVETLVTKTIVPSQAGHSYRRVLYHARTKII